MELLLDSRGKSAMGRCVVVGATGFIGSAIAGRLAPDGHDVVCAGRGCEVTCDLGLDDPMPDFEFAPLDYVVLAAAVSSPDRCERERSDCWRVNVEGTSALISRALEGGARVLFLSSDAVYPSDPRVAYDEESPADPKTEYGRMKAEVERRFAGEERFATIRLSYVVSKNDKYVSYLLGCAREGRVAEVFHPFYRSCTTLSDVLEVVSRLARVWSVPDAGVINVCGPELVSRVRIADELIYSCGVPLHYEIASPPDGFFASRPEITRMTSKYADKYGLNARSSFSEKLRYELKGLN